MCIFVGLAGGAWRFGHLLGVGFCTMGGSLGDVRPG